MVIDIISSVVSLVNIKDNTVISTVSISHVVQYKWVNISMGSLFLNPPSCVGLNTINTLISRCH